MREALSNNTDVDACECLLELRGVGRWTAEYVLLRGLGRLHVFPGDDVGAQKRLARWLGRPNALDYDAVRRAVTKWQPYAGLVYFHLLLDGLMQTGALSDSHGTESSQGQHRTRRGTHNLLRRGSKQCESETAAPLCAHTIKSVSASAATRRIPR
jgi:endonuclease III